MSVGTGEEVQATVATHDGIRLFDNGFHGSENQHVVVTILARA